MIRIMSNFSDDDADKRAEGKAEWREHREQSFSEEGGDCARKYR